MTTRSITLAFIVVFAPLSFTPAANVQHANMFSCTVVTIITVVMTTCMLINTPSCAVGFVQGAATREPLTADIDVCFSRYFGVKGLWDVRAG